MGKGDKRRPRLVSRAEYELRYSYAYGDITKEEFLKQLKEIRNVSGNSGDKTNREP